MDTKELHTIQTDIDKFYGLIREEGTVSEPYVCKSLNLDKKHVQKYAEILSRAKKIKAKYPLIGSPVYFLADKKKPDRIKKVMPESNEPKNACPNCGNPLKENAKFCTKCGKEVK
ncbi:MAG: zinc-ribbon domain-containing protein [Candidatus Nanoarchaeia archaeon]